jgi:hypothetical protein
MRSSKGKIAGAALCVLLACASDPCSDGASAAQNVASYIAGCAASDQGFFGGYSPCFDQNACETNLKSCSQADRAVLEATAKCQNEYASSNACTFAELQIYDSCAASATTAADGGSALSPACAEAFSQNPGSCGADAG